MMLRAIHAQENKETAREKARQVAVKLQEIKLGSASRKLQDGIEETLTSQPGIGAESEQTIRSSG